MNETVSKITSFTQLRAWKKGHLMVLKVYTLTKSFSKEEIFGLTSQMRRSAISFTSNIAEGFSRQSYKEKIQFYSIALGSLTELQNQLLVARDVGYLSKKDFDDIAARTVEINKITNGLLKKSKSLIRDS